MKESYSEIVAEYAGPESYADDGNIVGVATAGVHAGPEIELRYQAISRADTVKLVEGNIDPIVNGEIGIERGGVEDLEHVWKLQAREPGDPIGSLDQAEMAHHRDGQKTSPRAMLT
jgi:hypothetical protein